MRRTIFLFAAALFAAVLFVVTTFSLTSTAKGGSERLSSKELQPAPVVEEPFSWTGFYIGGNLGGEFSQFDFGPYSVDTTFDQFIQANQLFGNNSSTEFSDSFFFRFPGQDAGTSSKFIGGGQIGFQKQWGHFVLGAEGDFQRSSGERSEKFEASNDEVFNGEFDGGVAGISSTSSTVTANTQITSVRKAQTDWMASARLRVGYARGPVLLYITGGAAFAEVNAWAIDTTTTNFQVVEIEQNITGPHTLTFTQGPFINTNISKDDDVLIGWTGGIGGEYAFNDIFSIAMEYRHSDLGDHTFHFASGNSIFPSTMKVSLENDMALLKFNVRLNTLFGFGH